LDKCKFFWVKTPTRASGVFNDTGQAEARAICGKFLNNPDYWKNLTVSDFDLLLVSIDKLEQVTQELEWSRTAFTCSVIANIFRDKEKKKEPFVPADFMPKFGQETEKKQTWQEQLAIIEVLNAALGGIDTRGVGE
jgi:hypothetical protein